MDASIFKKDYKVCKTAMRYIIGLILEIITNDCLLKN